MILHFLTLQNALKMVDDRIQKNQQNGQTLMLALEKVCPILCPVRCTLRMVLRARQLNQPNSMPLGCYRTKKTSLVYMTPNRMAILIQELVKGVHPGIATVDLKIIQPTLYKSGHVSFSTKQAKVRITSASASAGWATPFTCTSTIQESYKTCISKCFDHHCRRSLTSLQPSPKLCGKSLR
jgi:hypothetical protein